MLSHCFYNLHRYHLHHRPLPPRTPFWPIQGSNFISPFGSVCLLQFLVCHCYSDYPFLSVLYRFLMLAYSFHSFLIQQRYWFNLRLVFCLPWLLRLMGCHSVTPDCPFLSVLRMGWPAQIHLIVNNIFSTFVRSIAHDFRSLSLHRSVMMGSLL